MAAAAPLLFDAHAHPLFAPLLQGLQAESGSLQQRRFPDGESYLCINDAVQGRDCIVLVDLCNADARFLSLVFLCRTLHELGAAQVGLIAPYLSYMRQDMRFLPGEALSSKIFASLLSAQVDWLVTVDPHLHRYHDLQEIYPIPTRVVHGAPVLVEWLGSQQQLLLVGPDEESAQWVSEIAALSGHPWVTGVKTRLGDRNVSITLPDLTAWRDRDIVIIDDVIASGHTVLQCMKELRGRGFSRISCACIHGIFADGIDQRLLQAGLVRLVSCNTIPHATNALDVSGLLLEAVRELV